MSLVNTIIASIAFLAGCIVLALGMSHIREPQNFVTVKGLSEKEVVADQAWWSINAQYGANTMDEVQSEMANIQDMIIEFLRSKGFTNDEISVEGLNVYSDNYREALHRMRADLKISVSTDDIEKVKTASNAVGELMRKGILIQSDQWASGPKYYFTKFQDVKKEMLAEATHAALEAAEEFATNSGAEVGDIRRANQGVFQILPANQTQENEVFYDKKLIRVVSTFDYYLE